VNDKEAAPGPPAQAIVALSDFSAIAAGPFPHEEFRFRAMNET
jgi:hypothetical protein